MSTYVKDLLERLLWTIAQVTVGVLVVEAGNWDAWWAVPVAAALMAAKGYIARYIGDPDSAATLPAPADPGADG